jgi:hypothetical protein
MKPVSQVVPHAIALLLREGPISPGKIDFAWKTTVGPAMARMTAVKLDAGVLVVEAKTLAWGNEVSRSSGVVLARLQSLLGDGVIHRILVRK